MFIMNSEIDEIIPGRTGDYIQTVSFTTVNIADCKSIRRIFGDCKSFYDLVSHKCYLFEKKIIKSTFKTSLDQDGYK